MREIIMYKELFRNRYGGGGDSLYGGTTRDYHSSEGSTQILPIFQQGTQISPILNWKKRKTSTPLHPYDDF